MEQLAGVVEDYVEAVEDKEDVSANVAQIHAALLEEVQNWEVGASLLVESVKALSEGDEELFEAKAEAAGEAVQAAGAAREEVLEVIQAVLGRTEDEVSD